MEYLILFAVLLGMGLLLFVKGIWDRRRQRVYMQEKIRESFGRPGERKYEDGETEGIPRYFEKHREGFSLDDVTWNDLNLDMLFLRMNTTLSSAGQEYLYYMLRTPCFDLSELSRREKMIRDLTREEEIRLKLQMLYLDAGRTGKYSLYDYLDFLEDLGERGSLLQIGLDLLFLPAIALTALNPPLGIVAIVGLMSFNIATYLKQRKVIDPYLTSFRYIFRCIRLSEKLAQETRCTLMDHLCRIPRITYEGLQTGQLQAVVRNDVQQGADMIYSTFSRIGLNVLLFAANFVYMTIISPALAVLVAGFTLVMAFINQKILTRQKYYRKLSRDAAGEVSETVLGTCKGMGTVKAYNAGHFILSLFKEKKKKYNDAMYKSEVVDTQRLTAYNLTSNFILYASVLYLGNQGIQGKMNWGDILVFILLIRQISITAEVIFRWMSNVATGLAAWERVKEIMQIPEEAADTGKLPEPQKELCAGNIAFRYGQQPDILHGQKIRIRRGEVAVLMGESGSGKTTLCKAICGLYPPKNTDAYRFEVAWELDGNIQQIGKAANEEIQMRPTERSGWQSGIVKWCAYSPATPQLFHMSIYGNIVFDRTEITREECLALADELGVGNFIRGLPEGIDTIVEAGGKTFSGGQRQAIMNMRALLSEKKFLILDEAFASLDVDKCDRLMNHLQNKEQDRFILLVLHQKQLAECCQNKIFIKA